MCLLYHEQSLTRWFEMQILERPTSFKPLQILAFVFQTPNDGISLAYILSILFAAYHTKNIPEFIMIACFLQIYYGNFQQICKLLQVVCVSWSYLWEFVQVLEINCDLPALISIPPLQSLLNCFIGCRRMPETFYDIQSLSG